MTYTVIEHADEIITYLATDDCIHRLQQLIDTASDEEITQESVQRWVDIVIQEHLDIVYQDVYDDYDGFVTVSITQENRNALDMITLQDVLEEV
jgi:hypothetical protein